jgi:hypothetical protein
MNVLARRESEVTDQLVFIRSFTKNLDQSAGFAQPSLVGSPKLDEIGAEPGQQAADRLHPRPGLLSPKLGLGLGLIRQLDDA